MFDEQTAAAAANLSAMCEYEALIPEPEPRECDHDDGALALTHAPMAPRSGLFMADDGRIHEVGTDDQSGPSPRFI